MITLVSFYLDLEPLTTAGAGTSLIDLSVTKKCNERHGLAVSGPFLSVELSTFRPGYICLRGFA